MEKGKISVVIIDDEITARSSLKKLLSGCDNYEVTADFSGGEEAVRWFEENKADIVLVDMNMPKQSGVELIDMLLSVRNNLCFIAVSGFDDFEYAVGCLKNQRVSDYLLKHQLTREGLLQALDAAQRKYGIREHEALQCKDEAVREIFEGRLSEEEIAEISEQSGIDMEYSDLVALFFSLDISEKGAGCNVLANSVAILKDIIHQVLQGQYPYLLHQSDHKSVELIVSYAGIKSYQYILNAETVMIRRIERLSERLLNSTVTIWVGRIEPRAVRALQDLGQFRQAAKNKLYDKPGTVHMNVSKESLKQGQYHLKPIDLKELFFELSLFREKNVYQKLNDIFTEIEKVRCSQPNLEDVTKKLIFTMQETYQLDQGYEQNDFEFIGQYKEYVWDTFQREMLRGRKDLEGRYDMAVVRALLYLNENFTEDITLETCSRHIDISYTHMSRLFNKQLGERFSEYLNKVRVSYASILIEKGGLSLKEIVSRSGFSNYNYFFKVFKEITGKTPSEQMKAK